MCGAMCSTTELYYFVADHSADNLLVTSHVSFSQNNSMNQQKMNVYSWKIDMQSFLVEKKRGGGHTNNNRNIMRILLCYFFYLEHEAVRHERDVLPTKPGEHSCILFIHYFLKLFFKEIAKYNYKWQMPKSWPCGLCCCIDWPWYVIP